jgi:hypothetical protein
MQLAGWIAALQPRFAQVWAYHAWNVAYNVAYEFGDPETRWKWVRRSLDLLGHDGLRYNPNHPVIRTELARLLYDRIGSRADPGQPVYLREWVRHVRHALLTGTRTELEQLRAVPAIALPPSAPDADRRTPEARAHYLRRDLAMDPDRMLAIDRFYGPFDWRSPLAHAAYWALDPVPPADTVARPADQVAMARQILELSFYTGRIWTDDDVQTLFTSCNLDTVPAIHAFYDAMTQADRSPQTTAMHRRFLQDAIALLYSFNRREEAEPLFAHYRTDHPDDAAPTLDIFVVNHINRTLEESGFAQKQAMLQAALFQAAFWAATGDADRARGFTLVAQRAWDRHQTRFALVTDKLLPPFHDLQRQAFTLVMVSDLAPAYKDALHRLGPSLQVPTDQPPRTETEP